MPSLGKLPLIFFLLAKSSASKCKSLLKNEGREGKGIHCHGFLHTIISINILSQYKTITRTEQCLNIVFEFAQILKHKLEEVQMPHSFPMFDYSTTWKLACWCYIKLLIISENFRRSSNLLWLSRVKYETSKASKSNFIYRCVGK